MAFPRTSPLPKAPLVVSAGLALMVATSAVACGDDSPTGGSGEGGTENQGGAPGISGGGVSEGGAPGTGGAGGDGGIENIGGAPGISGGAGG